jgi:hypothetical protein
MIIILLFTAIIITNIFAIFKFYSRISAIDTKKWAYTDVTFQIVELIPRSISLLIIPISVYFSEEILMKKADLDSDLLTYSILFECLGLIMGLFLVPNFIYSLNKLILLENKKSSILDFIKFYFIVIFYKKKGAGTILNFLRISNHKFFRVNIFTGFFLSIIIPLLVLLSMHFINHRGTLISLIPVFIGIIYVIFTYFVLKPIGHFTDLAYDNKIKIEEFKNILKDCILGKILGTLLAFFSIIPILKILIKFTK